MQTITCLTNYRLAPRIFVTYETIHYSAEYIILGETNFKTWEKLVVKILNAKNGVVVKFTQVDNDVEYDHLSDI